jgi:hypothetical protein
MDHYNSYKANIYNSDLDELYEINIDEMVNIDNSSSEAFSIKSSW